MRRCETVQEASLSSVVPPVVNPLAVVRRRAPATLSGVVDNLKRQKYRLAKRLSKRIKPSSSAVG